MFDYYFFLRSTFYFPKPSSFFLAPTYRIPLSYHHLSSESSNKLSTFVDSITRFDKSKHMFFHGMLIISHIFWLFSSQWCPRMFCVLLGKSPNMYNILRAQYKGSKTEGDSQILKIVWGVCAEEYWV